MEVGMIENYWKGQRGLSQTKCNEDHQESEEHQPNTTNISNQIQWRSSTIYNGDIQPNTMSIKRLGFNSPLQHRWRAGRPPKQPPYSQLFLFSLQVICFIYLQTIVCCSCICTCIFIGFECVFAPKPPPQPTMYFFWVCTGHLLDLSSYEPLFCIHLST